MAPEARVRREERCLSLEKRKRMKMLPGLKNGVTLRVQDLRFCLGNLSSWSEFFVRAIPVHQ